MDTWIALEAAARALAAVPGAALTVETEERTLLVAAAAGWHLEISSTYHERRIVRPDGAETWQPWACDTIHHRVGRCAVALHCYRPATREEIERIERIARAVAP